MRESSGVARYHHKMQVHKSSSGLRVACCTLHVNQAAWDLKY